MEIKVNIGDSKSKKTYNKTLDENSVSGLLGKKVGETITGELIDLAGYEMLITGGSDSSGFPMRKDVEGFARKRIFIAGGVGMKATKRKGMKLRKMVAGNTIYEKTAQINLKVTKWGKDPIEKAPEPEAAAEGEEAPKAEE